MGRSVTCIAAIALAGLANIAAADTVRLDDFVFVPAKLLNLTGGPKDYTDEPSGEFTGVLNGKTFLTYCTDIAQNFNFGVTYTDYSVVDGTTAFGAKSVDIDRLMSAVMSSPPTGATSSAVVQAAIWEILYESGSSYSFGGGSFKVSSSDASMQSALNLADTNWVALAATPITYHVSRLYSPTQQDFLVLTPVPEPSTVALMLAGLVGVGWTANRRTRRR